MKTIRDIQFFEGVKVLVRADFNVPVSNGKVVEDFRIRAALPTIDFLRSKGAKIILMSHLESADGGNGTLEPVSRQLAMLGVNVSFIENYKKASSIIESGNNGDCFLLENLRFYDGEKANDKTFSKELASLADIYVNDGFSVSHREHASVVGVPKFLPGYAGLQLEQEVLHLSKAFSPSHPFLFILGGAKFSTKMPLIEKFSTLADSVFIGGALANDYLKAKGNEVGVSLVAKDPIDLSGIIADQKISSFIDVVTIDKKTKNIDHITPDDLIADAGPATLDLLAEKIRVANFILWNGPFGVYEKGFTRGTTECARLIALNKTATKIVGGGDTLAAIASLGLEDKFTFVSTGGGAMLDFLANGTLVGIEALKQPYSMIG